MRHNMLVNNVQFTEVQKASTSFVHAWGSVSQENNLPSVCKPHSVWMVRKIAFSWSSVPCYGQGRAVSTFLAIWEDRRPF